MKFHLGSPPAGLIHTVGFSATSRNAVTLSRRWRERSALGHRGAANRAGRRSPAIAVTVASINSRKSGLGPQTLPYPIRHRNSPEPLPTPRAAAERNRHDGEFAITSSPGIPGTLIGTLACQIHSIRRRATVLCQEPAVVRWRWPGIFRPSDRTNRSGGTMGIARSEA